MIKSPCEVRYLHNKKIIKLVYPDSVFEVKVFALFLSFFDVESSEDLYIEYIHTNEAEATFGFSNGKSYSVAFDVLFDIAVSISKEQLANGAI